MNDSEFTHICTIADCPNPLLKLYKDKSTNWGASKCVEHLKKYHKDNDESKGVMESLMSLLVLRLLWLAASNRINRLGACG